MLRQTGVAALVILCGSFNLPAFAATPQKSEKSDPARAAVEKVLSAEVAGQVDRREQLADTIKTQPDSSQARWQAGYVRDGKGWQSFDEPNSSIANSESRQNYLSRREQAANDFAGQFELANWCRKQGLFDREQAHLTAALAQAPQREQAALLRRLGCQQVAAQWFSREQVSEWQRSNHAAEMSIKKWSSKLERIAARLTATKKVRESALAELHALADRSAIPAIELILTGQDEDCAKAAIETYRRIAGPESSLALAKQAVFSKWPDVRKSASAELKLRKLEDFVPALTSLLAVPAQGIRHMFLFDASGATLLHSYIVAVETEDQFRVQVFNVVNRTVDRVVAVAPRGMPGAGIPAERVVVGAPYRIPDDLRNLADRLYAQEREQSATDDRIRELNDRVINVLGSISGIEGSTDPRQWWQWWYAFTDTQTAAAKSVALIDEYDTTLPTYVPVIVRVSCFAAGVPVMTESGPRAIESVRIGDRVLSQDIETGELAYKPVVQTTVRPPKELTALRFANETIVCTSGHRFWSSAEGWVKARDLTPQMMLHTVTGNTPVHSAKKVEPAATYNLVIADFHTYFVGQTGLLCQDLIIPRSTNSVLPGLARK